MEQVADLHRDFYDDYDERKAGGGDAQQHVVAKHKSGAESESESALVAYVRENVVGRDHVITTPYGPRGLEYCDYTASGRGLRFIEEYMMTRVLPMYSNTHTLTSQCGKQSTLFRQEARDIVRDCVGASKDDVVLFTGSGASGAVQLLMHVLRTRQMLGAGTTVLIGPFEHHANILPWIESGCDVVRVAQCLDEKTGFPCLDLKDLKQKLEQYAPLSATTTNTSNTPQQTSPSSSTVIGAFQTASNVTGLVTDDRAVAALLNQHGALSVWDGAAGAPYLPLEMNPENHKRYTKHALFFSPHKFVGGVGTPGVLVIKKHLINGVAPFAPVGGTVFYVAPERHSYLQNFEERHEGGTPNITGAIRCGLAMQLKQQVGTRTIHARDQVLLGRFLQRMKTEKNFLLMGYPSDWRTQASLDTQQVLPILSFVIALPEECRALAPEGLLLHQSFVSVLLNDLFGIQSRSGCLCAGPYAHVLLGIDSTSSLQIEQALMSKVELLRPGFTRINLSYFMTEEQVDFVAQALAFVCRHAYKLLPDYVYRVKSGEWQHKSWMSKFQSRMWLSDVKFNATSHTMTSKDPNSTSKAPPGDLMAAAEELVAKVEAVYCNKGVEKAVAQNDGLMMDAKNSALRWFVLPSEAVLLMNKEQVPGAKVTLVTCARASSPSSPSSPSAEQRSGSSSSSSSGAMDVDVKTQQTTAPEATAASNKKKMEADDNVCGNCFHVHRPLDASSSSSSSVSVSSSAASHASSVECVSCECTTFQPQSMLAATKANKKKLTKVFNRLVGRAVFDFDMIREGDRILVGVSGGKDSLTLVHVLRALQRKSPVKFDIGCVTVDPMTPEYDPSSLIEYFAGLGIPYFYEKQGILDAAKACLLGIGQSPCGPEGCSVEDDNADVAESKAKKNRVSLCAYCARMKRGVLYSTCKREGYNVLALGQHLDDLAESFLMSAFHNGLLRTMKAHYAAADHDLRIIRPLVYVRESLTRQFSSVFELPIINENCPACFEAPKERARMKKVLASQEQIHPQLYLSLQKTMMPLMAIPTAHSTTLDLSFDPKKTAQSKKEQQRKAINERKALRGGRNPKANGKRPAADPPSSSSSSSGDSSHKRAKKQ